MKYLVIDTETGGLNAHTDALLSVATISLNEGLDQESFYTSYVLDPDKTVTPEALAVNHLDMALVARDGQPVKKVIDYLNYLSEGRVIVAHNAQFDLNFLGERGFGLRGGESVEYQCTYKLSRKLYPGWPHHDLKSACQYAGIASVLELHTALGDAMAVADFWRFLVSRWPSLAFAKPYRCVFTEKGPAYETG